MDGIVISGLTKKYRDCVAVDGLDLTIGKGELFSLLGVNGAGKTTTIKMLSCLLRPDGGDALLWGRSIIKEPQAVKSVIGVSPQETAVAPNLTVKENLELMAGVHGFDRRTVTERTEALLDQFALGVAAGKQAKRLSGGLQRRLSIAMALISRPKILFLDEPTIGLDVIARSELWDVIRALNGETTVILTTHYMEEAETLSDRIAIMKEGRLVTVGTAREIMEQAGKDRFEDAFIKLVKGGETR